MGGGGQRLRGSCGDTRLRRLSGWARAGSLYSILGRVKPTLGKTHLTALFRALASGRPRRSPPVPDHSQRRKEER